MAERLDGTVALVTGPSSGIGAATAVALAGQGAAVALAPRRRDRLDTLVNNAGLMLLRPVLDAPMSEWQRMVGLNVLGLLYCAHAALPHLLRAPEDSPRPVADMVNISLEMLHAEDIADAVSYIVTRPRRVAVNEMLVRPTEQEL